MKDPNTKKYIFISKCIFCILALCILLYFLLYRASVVGGAISSIFSALQPFLIGAVVAYVIWPICCLFEDLFYKCLKHAKTPEKRASQARGLGAAAGILITLIAIYIMLIIIVPQLITSVLRLVELVPTSSDTLTAWLQNKLSRNPQLLSYSQEIVSKYTSFLENWMSSELLTYLQNFASGISTGVINIVITLTNILIGFIVAAYLLVSRSKFVHQTKLIIYSIFDQKYADTIREELLYVNKVFSGFIQGKILDSILVAFICYLGMLIFRLLNPSASGINEILIAVIVGLFNIIPFFGQYIGLLIPALLILIVSPVQCIYFIVFDAVLQQVDGNILGPKIIGNTTGLSGFWVLFSILFFGHIWGFIGVLISVPLFAVIYHIIKKLVFWGLDQRGLHDLKNAYIREFPEKQQTSVKEDMKQILNRKENKEDKEEQM